MTTDWNHLRFMIRLHFESWQGAVQFDDSILSLHEEINSYYWPWCKPMGNTFQTNYSLPQWFACGVSFIIFPDYQMIYALAQRPIKAIHIAYLYNDLTCRREKKRNDSLRAAVKREDLSVKTCFVCRIFFPSLLGRQGCSWWILKQISLIIVFHNCHVERDCPLRSYLCHCISFSHSLPLSAASSIKLKSWQRLLSLPPRLLNPNGEFIGDTS